MNVLSLSDMYHIFLKQKFVMLLRLFIAALWSLVGKGLTSWLSFVMLICVFVSFPCGILGQVWYMIVIIPDLCLLSYFLMENIDIKRMTDTLNMHTFLFLSLCILSWHMM